MNAHDNWADDAHRYRLDSRIAAGGMGEVWRATDTSLGREVAVKLLKAELADDPLFRSRFESEARHAAALSHPGVAAVFDVGESSGERGTPRPYLVMELVDGQPLNHLLRSGAKMDPTAVRELLAQVGEALGAAHRAGIVHRDVKPGNLLVTPRRQVKVTDFGIARAAEAVALTQTGQVMGTPQYLSPEQAEGKVATAASDVYSLGVVAYECLAGRRPFEAESAIATALAHLRNPVPPLPDTVPADLAAVVMRSLSKKPEERFADGSEFAAALRDPATAVISLPPGGDLATQVNPAVAYDPGTQLMPATTATPLPGDPTGAQPTGAGGSRVDPDARHQVGWPVVAGVLLVGVVLLALVAWWVLGGDDEDPSSPPSNTPSATPSADASDEPEAVRVNPDDYLGRDARDVIEELRLLGLRVERDPQTNNGDQTPYEVTGIDPSGSLERGDRVTVTFWGEAPEEKPTPTPTPTEEPTPTPTAPTPTPTPTETTETTPTETPTPTEEEQPLPEGDSAPALLPGGQR